MTNRDLADLLSAINESGIASFHLKTQDYEISVSCVGDTESVLQTSTAAGDTALSTPQSEASAAVTPREGAYDDVRPQHSTVGDEPAQGPQRAGLPETQGDAESASAAPSLGIHQEQGGAIPILAPMVGAFYAAPEPGAPPYVELGAEVSPDSTVGLIEAMKVFTAVAAGVHGVLTEILVSNAEFVEYGQPLAFVKGIDQV